MYLTPRSVGAHLNKVTHCLVASSMHDALLVQYLTHSISQGPCMHAIYHFQSAQVT